MATFDSTTTNLLPKAQVQAVQSVTAMTATETRLVLPVSVPDTTRSDIFRAWCHAILYYQNVSGEDSGWKLAGWGKESLGRFLQERPIFAGRLRREEEGRLEIVSNDCGLRLFEARVQKTLSEFLELKEREDAEASLVYWKDIDEQNPQFSPLFYVQVTNFLCGGYSIGISSSLLLSDPVAMTTGFLKKWAKIHANFVSETDPTKLPLFYMPNLKPNSPSHIYPFGSNPSTRRGKAMIFKTTIEKTNMGDEMRRSLALQCIEEAEKKLNGAKMASEFSLLVKLPPEEIKVEKYTREGLKEKMSKFNCGLSVRSWDELGAAEVSFHGGNMPLRVSWWINSGLDEEGLVVLAPNPDEGASEMNAIVTVPSET
ncbi:Rosmarinate synthase [Bertholletia excelsa]